MNRHKLQLLLLCALTAFLSSGSFSQAHGQSLGISPVYVEAKVKNGATYKQAFTISNNSGARLRVKCSVGDYWYDENNQRVEGRAGTLPHSASLWVQFSPAVVTIEANASAKVNAVITVPLAATGGFYTAPIFEFEAADQPAGNQQAEATATASVAYSFSGLLMLTTEGSTEYNLEIMNGSVTPPTSSSALEMQFDLRNRSTAHVRVRGVFAVLDAAGKLVGRGKINEKRYMPGQRDVLQTSWAGELGPGRYTAITTLTYDRVGMEPATLVFEKSFEVK